MWESIPEELKINALFCVWKKNADGKKIPYDSATGFMAKSNDRRTFHTFAQTMLKISTYLGYDEAGHHNGGLGLGIFNGYSAIDIDHCRDPLTGKLSAMAEDIIDYCQSYTETSPSGEGVHVFFRSSFTFDKAVYYTNNHKIGLEVYLSDQTNKYVTMTGNALVSCDLRDVDAEYILNKYMRKDIAPVFDPAKYPRDEKLQKLWTDRPYEDNESAHDLALLSKLSYYLNGDRERVQSAFESSPYYNTKDDEHLRKWQRDDYRAGTLDKACANVPELKPETYARVDEFALTDTGNAHKFCDAFGENVKYNVDNKRWMSWNGKFWQTDVYGNMKNFAETAIESMKQEARLSGGDLYEDMMRNVRRALSSQGKTAMLKEAEHLPGIPVTNDMFDADSMVFNCKSGVVNLRTGDISEPTRDMMLSQYSPYEIDTAHEPRLWLKFLGEIFKHDEDAILYLQKILGYSMTGSTREQCMFMLIGDGANGKSLLLEVMNRALGSYAATSNVEVLLEKKNGNNQNLGDVARLKGIRNVVTAEARLGDRLDESAIKTLTHGNDKIVARFLYGNEFEFTPIMKLFMASNYRPIIRGTDHGIWRSIRVIPFNVVIPDNKQDKDLITKLAREIPQILGWMLQGCMFWQVEGLQTPQSFMDMMKEYRSEMDVVQKWIDESCVLSQEFSTSSNDLFHDFTNYVTVNKEYQLTNTMFGRNLSKKFIKNRKLGVTYYSGIGLKKRDYSSRDDGDSHDGKYRDI